MERRAFWRISMRRPLVTVTLSALLAGVPTFAAAQQATTVGLAGAFAAADLATSDLAPAIAASTPTEEARPLPSVFEAPRTSQRTSLTALSVMSAALQGLDAYTTLSAVGRGAREANPVVRGAVGNPAVFMALKSSMTAATIYAAQRMWPRNKGAAIAMLAITNGVMGGVVAHNMSVLRQMR